VCLNLGIGQQTPPVASVLPAVCSATGLKIEDVMGCCKWFIAAMFVTLLIVSFSPWTTKGFAAG
ncbi:MAG: TRAP transporter large permease, partial [Pseudomonadota bacterium]